MARLFLFFRKVCDRAKSNGSAGRSTRQQLSVIPFASVTSDQAIEEDDAKAGADLVWKVSPEFQVSATVNLILGQ